MPVSESQKRATAKYEKENYDKVLVRFPKGTKNRIKDTGADSVNSYIINCVLNALNGSRDAKVSTKTEEPEKTPKAPEELNKPEKKSSDLSELQKLLDQKKADVVRDKKINDGKFMTVAREEEERYNNI